ncbi:MAG: insulinase family protein [Hyphomicrobiales bacterium]|nr:insulinase family protein [Hyphomicrobiales bacterium]
MSPSAASVSPQTAAGLTPGAESAEADARGPALAQFKLENGLDVLVIPDHRAPVVTHMIWYRNGSADDPSMKSGIAHFLEHLMFKGTKKHPKGEFSDMVSELGGQENAFTSYDFTAYYQRVPKEHLRVMMEFEADRMTNLVLTDEIVAPERDVVLEERRMRTDNDPSQQLGEEMSAALYAHHPYGTPVIGWHHEIEKLGRQDALDYYGRFYTPENAILIVAGDVDEGEVRTLASETYGKIPARGEAPERARPQEPEPRAHKLVSLSDEKVEQPIAQQLYLVPSYRTAAPGEGEALDLLGHILGGGLTSHLYRKLVVEDKIAVAAGASYWGNAYDDTRFHIYAVPPPGVSLEELEDAVIDVIDGMCDELVDPGELTRAKTRLIADTVYAQDSQVTLARVYGMSLTTGSSVKDVQKWPEMIEAVTAEDIRNAARKWLQRRRSVTGYLLPAGEGMDMEYPGEGAGEGMEVA